MRPSAHRRIGGLMILDENHLLELSQSLLKYVVLYHI